MLGIRGNLSLCSNEIVLTCEERVIQYQNHCQVDDQFQWVCSESYSDSTVYQKRSSEPSMEVDKLVFQTSAFPNPAHRGDPLSVKGIPEGMYAISLQDLNGKLLLFDELAIEKDEFIQVAVPAHIDTGVYLLRLENNDQVFTFKISVL